MDKNKISWTTKEDLIVIYVFNYCVEADIEEIDGAYLDDIMLGATDEMQDDYNQANVESR